MKEIQPRHYRPLGPACDLDYLAVIILIPGEVGGRALAK